MDSPPDKPGKPDLSRQHRHPAPASQWTAGLGPSLRQAEVLPHGLNPGVSLEIRHTPSCLWAVLKLSPDIQLGFRAAFCPTGLLAVRRKKSTASILEYTASTGMGDFHVRIELLASGANRLRFTTTLTPDGPLLITASPTDLCVLDRRFDPWHGDARRYTCQEGYTAGQTFFAVPAGEGANIFYLQNLSALDDYCRHTGATVKDTVTGEWPEEGFALPQGPRPLPGGQPVLVNDAFLSVEEGRPHTEVEAAIRFLDNLAFFYPLLPPREAPWQDWPAHARRTLTTLTRSSLSTRRIDKKDYMQAYAGSDYKPPESMVQGAFLVPLAEYQSWDGRPNPLLKRLSHAPTQFFDPSLRIPLRWLPGVPFGPEADSEEEVHERMDSWYLLHTMMNIGRLATMGHEKARQVFLDSLDTLIHNARHFDYAWPVFYNQRNLSVFKPETAPGEGGEQDAGGLYIKVMLQAWDLTHRQEYLDEAEACAAKLECLAFGFLYQTNNTAMGAVALARLWRITGKAAYRELSLVAMASIFSHLWLWHHGTETRTWMGLPPLHDAPYIALYEEGEILASFLDYHDEMREALPESIALLTAEYQKHLLARAHFYYPSELPESDVSPEPKEGVLNRRLFVPLEGLGGPDEKAGTVGQAVYAAAAPFILTTRCWHRRPEVPFTLYCSYPLHEMEQSGTRRQGELRFRTGGTAPFTCELRLLPSTRSRLQFTIQTGTTPAKSWQGKSSSGLIQELPGATPVCIAWKSKA